MHIKSVSIENYKSIYDGQTLNFEPGFNLLLGSNNAGKTTVLDALDLNLGLNEPHRSQRTLPQRGDQPREPSVFAVTLSVRFSELWRIAGRTQLYLPIPDLALNENTLSVTRNAIWNFIDADHSIYLTSRFGNGNELVSLEGGSNPIGGSLFSGSVSRGQNKPVPAALIQYVPSQPDLKIGFSTYKEATPVVGDYAQNFKSRIYRFNAERRPSPQCGAAENAVLDRNATQLPYCINHLQTSDSYGHRKLCELVHRVFPSVKWVHAPPIRNGFELRCLPLAPEAQRDDLSISLGRMGAGIGNVIAMLYVVLTSHEPQVILIDEPNAFLHPRALRELLAILESEGRNHQFILTAHSAEVLTAVNTKTISLFDFDGVTTSVRQVGANELHQLRSNLAEIGIRMTDLHAKDRVLWVEGRTEELVMPEILRWACPEIAAGTSVLRVENTGAFNKRSISPTEVAGIYTRLSSSSALVPPMVCVLLDGETRDKKNRDELEKSSGGQLRFLERRMLENYLLHPSAIAAVLKDLGPKATPEKVSELLKDSDDSQDYGSIDGAAQLAQVFSKLSETTQEFRKTRDVPTLVSWILRNDPDFLAPLRAHLRKIFGI